MLGLPSHDSGTIHSPLSLNSQSLSILPYLYTFQAMLTIDCPCNMSCDQHSRKDTSFSRRPFFRILGPNTLLIHHSHAKSNNPSPSKYNIPNHRLNIPSSSGPFPDNPSLALIPVSQPTNHKCHLLLNANNDTMVPSLKTVSARFSLTPRYRSSTINR